jgi:nucleoside 2-deoxyribosyltransferase
VKVFISSVRYMLKDERDNLPPLLHVLDHEPLRFEDFTSQDASSRAACLAGVNAADVYVLLLGPKYGDPFPDTGLSPTAEEFVVARNRGIPILVFAKDTDHPDEPAQADFKAQVGHYVNGRFWKSFNDPLSLNLAVVKALKTVHLPGGPLRLLPVGQPPLVPWRTEQTGLRPREVDAPVLELHLLPNALVAPVGAAALATAAKALARDLRATGFVPDDQPLQAGSDNTSAWAFRPPETTRHRTNSPVGRTEEAWRGAAVTTDGAATGWLSLPRDMFGSLLDQPTLHRHVAALLGLLRPHVGQDAAVALAARLAPAEQVQEGDPGQIGHRNSGGWSQARVEIRIEPAFAVSTDDLHTGDLAAEITTRLLNDIRQIRRS